MSAEQGAGPIDTREKILAILSRNARVSLVELANMLGISHVAVRKHIQKLESSGILRIQGNINLHALGYKLTLVFMEVVNEEYMRKIIDKFRDCPRIVFLANMIGGYNLVALMYAENEDVLECFSSVCAIRTMEGIRRTEVYLLSSIVKPEHLPIQLPTSRSRKESPCGHNCSKCSKYMINKCLGCPATMYYKGGITKVGK